MSGHRNPTHEGRADHTRAPLGAWDVDPDRATRGRPSVPPVTRALGALHSPLSRGCEQLFYPHLSTDLNIFRIQYLARFRKNFA
jgi:hypothetical protein